MRIDRTLIAKTPFLFRIPETVSTSHIYIYIYIYICALTNVTWCPPSQLSLLSVLFPGTEELNPVTHAK